MFLEFRLFNPGFFDGSFIPIIIMQISCIGVSLINISDTMYRRTICLHCFISWWFKFFLFFFNLNEYYMKIHRDMWLITPMDSVSYRTPQRNLDKIFSGRNGKSISNTGNINFGSTSSGFWNPNQSSLFNLFSLLKIFTREKTNHYTHNECRENRKHRVPKIAHSIKSQQWIFPICLPIDWLALWNNFDILHYGFRETSGW